MGYNTFKLPQYLSQAPTPGVSRHTTPAGARCRASALDINTCEAPLFHPRTNPLLANPPRQSIFRTHAVRLNIIFLLLLASLPLHSFGGEGLAVEFRQAGS